MVRHCAALKLPAVLKDCLRQCLQGKKVANLLEEAAKGIEEKEKFKRELHEAIFH